MRHWEEEMQRRHGTGRLRLKQTSRSTQAANSQTVLCHGATRLAFAGLVHELVGHSRATTALRLRGGQKETTKQSLGGWLPISYLFAKQSCKLL